MHHFMPCSQEIETDEYGAPYEYDDSPEKSAETYFGKSPDNLPCVRDLRDQSKDVFLQQRHIELI